jgi:hypothetical protein
VKINQEADVDAMLPFNEDPSKYCLSQLIRYLIVERTPLVLNMARLLQIEAAHKHEKIKQEIADWGIQKGPTLANMHLAQGHLVEQIEVGEELNDEEREISNS